MLKFIYLSLFVFIFLVLIRRDRVYVIPFILIIYSNINGLLAWDDFALEGFVKFQDYGVVVVLCLLGFGVVAQNRFSQSGESAYRKSMLYTFILLYWTYYTFIFFYSISVQGGVEWPIKMSRVFFYGLVIFVIFAKLKKDPIGAFEKIINVLKYATLFFGIIYVAYNIFGIEFYAKDAYEEFEIYGMDSVKRNFAGFPTFSFYFLILFVHQIMTERKLRLLNLFGLILLAACVVLMLTRGALLAMIAVILLTIVYRKPSPLMLRNLMMIGMGILLAIPLLFWFADAQLQVLLQRFGEFSGQGGATQSDNFLVRSTEFFRIIKNVTDFNPILGFGFTNISLLGLGYQSTQIHGGSADNGFSNLIGVTGFGGLALFLFVIVAWLMVNIRLQLLNKEKFSKINFIFILYLLASFMNGSSMSYMHAYALFLAYDLTAYTYLIRGRRALVGVAKMSQVRQLVGGR